MAPSQPVCPTAEQLDAIARGAACTDTIREHLARCRSCAEQLDSARFAQRFGQVMNDAPPESGALTESFPEVFGYRIVGELARGGQGVVYRAVQGLSGQEVAIKVLHARGPSDASRLARLRLLREIRVVASLQHPGIVRLLDALKLVDGRDALVMELVEGVPLDQWIRSTESRDTRTLLELLAEMADALHHAHQRGVIHRDLKPSNILVDASGRPHLLDFGVAGLTDEHPATERVTRTGEFTGTLAYAAPEQVASEHEPPDIRTDIYALGVIGYQALTGRMPYGVDGPIESVVRNITQAATPGRTQSGLAHDPWTVLSKAMSKPASRRYQSAAELASDLRRAARGQAIDARKDSRLYVVRMAVRRNCLAVAVSAALLIGLVGVLVVQSIGNTRLNESLRVSRIQQARAYVMSGERARAEQILLPELDRLFPAGDIPKDALWKGSRREREVLWALIEMQAHATCLSVEPAGIVNPWSLTSLEDGAFGIVAHDGQVGRIDLVDEHPILTWGRRIDGAITQAVYTPSARAIVVFGAHELRTIDARSGVVLAGSALPEGFRGVGGFAVVDDAIAICSEDGRIAAYSVPGLEEVLSPVRTGLVQIPWLDRTARWLAYIADPDTLKLVDLRTGVGYAPVHNAALETGTYTPYPQVLVTGDRGKAVISHSRGVIIAPLEITGAAPVVLKRSGYRVSAQMDPGEKYLSMRAFGDSTVRFWRLDTLEEVGGLPGHDGSVVLHAFTRDARRVLTIDSAGVLRVWAAPGHAWRTDLGGATSKTHALSIDRARMEVLATDANGVVHGHALGGGKSRVIGPQSAPPFDAVRSGVSHSGWVAIASLDSEIEFLAPDGTASGRLGLPIRESIAALQFRPGIDELAVCTQEGGLFIIDPATAGVLRSASTPPGSAVSDLAWSPDGAVLAIARRDGHLQIFDASGLSLRMDVAASTQQIRKIEYTPDGRTIAGVGDEGRLILINLATGEIRKSDRIAENSLFSMSVHPSATTIVVGDRTGRVVVVDSNSLLEMASLDGGGAVMSLAFTPEGDAVIVAPLERPVARLEFGRLVDSMKGIRQR